MSSADKHQRDFKDSLIPNEIDLKGRYCPRPFEHIEIMHGFGNEQEIYFGDVYVCCSGWLSKKIGNYLEDDLKSIWHSTAAQEIRESIYDGSFRYCNKQVCPEIQANRLPRLTQKTTVPDLPSSFFLCYDRSCNLSCKSCRNSLVHFKSGLGLQNPLRLNEKLKADLFSVSTKRRINIKITGSGDPFASVAFKQLIESLDGEKFPGLEIELYTNGLLFTPANWQKLEHIQKNIRVVSVSIDAASEKTYSDVRGGSWTQLMHNMKFLSQLRKQQKIQHFATNFVVQKKNYFEMASFVRLCKVYAVDRINFSFVSDWMTWSEHEFKEQCIWQNQHPEFESLLLNLIDSSLADKIAVLGPLTSYRKMALNKYKFKALMASVNKYARGAEKLYKRQESFL